jgi:subtilisin-like proprotein convertase family protein
MSVTELSISVAQNISIEQLYVTVDYQHDDVSQMVIDLVSPDGTVFRLMNGDGAAGASFNEDFTFGVRGLVGTSSVGEWTVRLTDTAPGGTGWLRDVDLQFRGAATTMDTVHHLTQDYFTSLFDADPSRQTLSDTDGGNDWLNLAALEGDVHVVLKDNTVLTLSGQGNVARLDDGSTFDNVALGDGNDTASGNVLSNEMFGGRGDDGLSGFYGADVLIGGAGNDILSGDGAGVTSLETAQAATEQSATLDTASDARQQWTDEVFRLYQAAFDRAPDVGGFANWTQCLGEGMSFTDAIDRFINSSEFTETYGDPSDAGFVTQLYNNVLDRAPDQAELASWVEELATGALDRAGVMESFVQSSEFVQRTAAELVSFMRGQALDDRLQGGTGDNILFGGSGRDVFDFRASSAASTHVIKDFEAWDLIDLSGLGFASMADLTFANSGQDVRVALGNGGTLTVEDWQDAGFVEANFIF